MNQKWFFTNSFLANVPILYPIKKPENLWFLVFSGSIKLHFCLLCVIIRIDKIFRSYHQTRQGVLWDFLATLEKREGKFIGGTIGCILINKDKPEVFFGASEFHKPCK